MTYPDATVKAVLGEFVEHRRLDIMKEREEAKRLGARWTPTLIFLEDGVEHRRFVGYYPPRDFACEVLLARGHADFFAGRHDRAKAVFDRAAKEFADAEGAPEAMYWAGVCGFKMSKSTQPIYDACKAIVATYPGHFWARKLAFTAKYKDFNLR